jgi:hypothetical protein
MGLQGSFDAEMRDAAASAPFTLFKTPMYRA